MRIKRTSPTILTRLMRMSASSGHSAELRLGFCARSHVESPLIGAPQAIAQVCPSAMKGGQVMAALDQFLVSNPDMVEKSYGDVMAASPSRAFPCQAQ